MNNDCQSCDVIIVGGGIAGLAAAQKLKACGRKVLVIEKSRGVGGRMASRRIGSGVFDHGAQFITARDARCIRWLEELENRAVVEKWFGGKDLKEGTYPRWRGNPAMTAIAKYVSTGLDLRLNMEVKKIEVKNDLWLVHSAEKFLAGSVLLTPPVPQCLSLLKSLGPSFCDDKRSLLEKFIYERCLVVMVNLAKPSGVPWPGFMRYYGCEEIVDRPAYLANVG